MEWGFSWLVLLGSGKEIVPERDWLEGFVPVTTDSHHAAGGE